MGGTRARQLRGIMEKENLPWRSFADTGTAGAGPIARAWNVSATPTFYLLDNRGVIRRRWAGPPPKRVLDEAVEALLRAAERE